VGEEENRAMGMDKDGIFLEQRSRDRRPLGLYFDKSSWFGYSMGVDFYERFDRWRAGVGFVRWMRAICARGLIF